MTEAAIHERLAEGHLDPIKNLQEMIDEGALIMGYHDEVEDGPEGIYVCNSEIVPQEFMQLKPRTIVRKEPLSQGAADTHHEVCFAKVKLKTLNEDEKEVFVGVKHYDDSLKNAISEANSLLAVRKRGFDVITPLAIVKESETSSYLITLFRPDVKGLDNENWAIRPGEEGFKKLTENLNFIAESLADLHAKGIFVGDEQPKNCLRSDTGHQVVVDLEEGCTVAETVEEQVNAFNDISAPVGTALHDLKLLWRTLNRPIGLREDNVFLGREATDDELYTVFRDQCVIPYLNQLEKTCNPQVLPRLGLIEVTTALDAQVRADLGLEANSN